MINYCNTSRTWNRITKLFSLAILQSSSNRVTMEDERAIGSQSNDILITAIGIPVVDVIATFKTGHLFDKFGIALDTHRPSSVALIKEIEKEIPKYSADIVRIAGGCLQNTLKIFQWLVKTKHRSAMIGAIGRDEDGAFLRRDLANNGVIPLYADVDGVRTCSVYALTYDNRVSYVYDHATSAAQRYSTDHLRGDERALASIRNSKVVLFEAFFTALNIDVNFEVLKRSVESDALTVFNLCGENMPLEYADAVLPFVLDCGIVVGNWSEFLALCQLMNVSSVDGNRALVDVHKTMLRQGTAPPRKAFKVEAMKTYRKILLVTDGEKPINCVYGVDSDVLEYRLSPVEPSLIQDPCGAGDSFLAGFLYGILKEYSLENCLKVGSRTATEIVKLKGCVVPTTDSSTVIASVEKID